MRQQRNSSLTNIDFQNNELELGRCVDRSVRSVGWWSCGRRGGRSVGRGIGPSFVPLVVGWSVGRSIGWFKVRLFFRSDYSDSYQPKFFSRGLTFIGQFRYSHLRPGTVPFLMRISKTECSNFELCNNRGYINKAFRLELPIKTSFDSIQIILKIWKYNFLLFLYLYKLRPTLKKTIALIS